MHLACTVKPSSQGCQCHNDSPAVVAFDGIERSDARQGPDPAQMFLQHISQVADIEGIPVILQRNEWKKTYAFNTGSPVKKHFSNKYYMMHCK